MMRISVHVLALALLCSIVQAFGYLKVVGTNRRRLLTIMNAIHTGKQVTIALTREDRENAKLRKLLCEIDNCRILNLPCISFAETEEVQLLRESFKTSPFSYNGYILTSPQAAEVFAKYWLIHSKNQVASKPLAIASVGVGTSKVLEERTGLKASFEPSRPLGEVLVQELPSKLGLKWCYPCSALAAETIPAGLRQRGFQCDRINAYSTVAANWTSAECSEAAQVDVVTIASPSTADIWCQRVARADCKRQILIAIGPTSARHVEQQYPNRFKKIIVPTMTDSNQDHMVSGLVAWAQTIRATVVSML